MSVKFFSPGPDDDTYMELELVNGTRMFGRFSDQYVDTDDDSKHIRFQTFTYVPSSKEMVQDRLWDIPVVNVVAAGRVGGHYNQESAELQLKAYLYMELAARMRSATG